MPKSKWVAFFLCLFFGVGNICLFTLGLCGAGVLIGLIILLFKPNPYDPYPFALRKRQGKEKTGFSPFLLAQLCYNIG